MTSVTGLAVQHPNRYPHGDTVLRSATLEEERREVFAGVLQAMREVQPDPAHLAACSYLLRHLARSRRDS